MSRIPQALWRRKRFFFEKRSKKLLLFGPVAGTAAGPGPEVFLLLFFKKRSSCFY
jgi:hypothetical protein